MSGEKKSKWIGLVAACILSVAAPLAQAATKTTMLEVAYGLGPSTNYGGTGRDNSLIAYEGEDHVNQGAVTAIRVVMGSRYTYLADWDTDPMLADLGPGGALIGPYGGTYGWGSYAPSYYVAIKQRADATYPDPVAWPDPSDPCIVNISSCWSENDWFEGDGADGWFQYNWDLFFYASTIWYAGDILITPMAIPWSFPGGGTGANAPYPAFPNCTFIETFHTMGDFHDFAEDGNHGPGWAPSTGEAKTPTNSTSFGLDNSAFFVNDNGTPADPNDDYWDSVYVEVKLDQAMMDDMFNNANHRGLALWEWSYSTNGPIHSADTNADTWPYIYARIEVCDGDANLDQVVDGLDYVAWSNNYLTGDTWDKGDFDGDLTADGLDYVIWSNNYFAGCPGTPGEVPEPAVLPLLAVGGLALLRRRSLRV